jgi:hypothetical protein
LIKKLKWKSLKCLLLSTFSSILTEFQIEKNNFKDKWQKRKTKQIEREKRGDFTSLYLCLREKKYIYINNKMTVENEINFF